MSRLTGTPSFLVVVSALAVAGLALPAPAAAQPAPCPGQTTIQDGETLVSLAARCGVTVPALLALNPTVRSNQDLAVGRAVAVPNPRAPQPRPQQACGEFYTVRDGDTLAGIALKCGLTVPLLVAANGPLPTPLSVNLGGTIRIPDVPRSAVRDTLTWVSPAPAVAPEAEASPAREALVRAEGVLTTGSPCPMLRTADGRTIALAGDRSRAFRAGDSVVVMGAPVPADRCGHAPALEVRILYRAEP
jgi:LysM repeat protein